MIVKKLKVSFGNAKYEHIAPVFGLDYNDRTLSGFGELEIFRSWLPGGVVEKICGDVDIADVQYGELVTHGNEEARSRYIATVRSSRFTLYPLFRNDIVAAV